MTPTGSGAVWPLKEKVYDLTTTSTRIATAIIRTTIITATATITTKTSTITTTTTTSPRLK
jgi:hypothetical protein